MIDRLNAMSEEEAIDALLRCCGCRRFARELAARRPFSDAAGVHAAADEVYRALDRDELLEAFRAHPRIGDREALRAKFAGTRAWAEAEQAGALGASDDVLDALAEGNREYERRFGHIFIICATGRSAGEMLAALRARLPNPPERELEIAAEEQRRITRLRLEKLISS
jgi:2-oxo-4-hydroxy-4-carboxy-5-ureidoimidazoline decarboxylase